jgi:diaminopimelate decarboxylase
LDALKSIQEKYKINIRTLHIHTGSEIKDVAVFMKSAEVFDTLLPHFPSVEVLDFGGGFKVPYAPGEQGTDMALLGAEVNKVMKQLSEKFGRNFTAWFEPGKYMVSEAGFFIAKVNVLKTSGDIIFAGLNTGLNHLIRPMFYDAYHQITNISNPAGELKTYNVVGNICETDTFAWDRELNEVRPNDLLVFNNAGAYGFEMSSRFNSRSRPAEVLIKDNQLKLIRRRETFDDIIEGVVFE